MLQENLRQLKTELQEAWSLVRHSRKRGREQDTDNTKQTPPTGDRTLQNTEEKCLASVAKLEDHTSAEMITDPPAETVQADE